MGKRDSVYVHFCKVLIIGLTAAIILDFTLWESHIHAMHTLLESICVFIGVSIFLIVWNTLDKVPRINNIIGFGFLFVAIFDAYHTYIYIVQSAFNNNLLDLSMKSWFLGRLAEAIVLYLATLKIRTIKINRGIVIALIFLFSFGINYMAYFSPEIFPVMVTKLGLTFPKIATEFIVILLTILTILNVKKNINDEASMSDWHLYISLLLIIPAEIMFTIYSSEYSLTFIYGHILKLLYHYYIYKSVFVSSIKYPYEKLELENVKLEEAYRQLEENKQEETRRQGILMQQEKLALLGQMGAGIVHETRNYLTTIKGSCQLARLSKNEEKVLKHLKNIDKNVEEIDNIMSKFLFMSKPRNTELLEISMYDLLQSVQSLIMSTSLMKKVDVFFETSKEERYLLCDEGQINQVVLNLCKNAVEAMEDISDAKLFIKMGYDEAANEIYISVRDNGRGISSSHLTKIGKPFFTTKDSGTGLGLYMCYQMIYEHNGRIEVISELGKGTNFIIKLPCLKEDEEEKIENTNDVC